MTDLSLFPEEFPPIVISPEELIAQGLMPQVPYEKLARVPEGWEKLQDHVVRASAGRIGGAPITARNLTLVRGRSWGDSEDPDRPVAIDRRLALFGIAATEGDEPAVWVVAFEVPGQVRAARIWTDDEPRAREAFARYEQMIGDSRVR